MEINPKNMTDEELKAAIQDATHLDASCLEQEVFAQSSRYAYWSEWAAKARSARDRAVNTLDRQLARAELGLREYPPAGFKVTEASIKAKILQDPEVIAQQEIVVEANEWLYNMESVIRALDHKKSQLGNARELYINGLYQDPKGDGKRAMGSTGVRNGLNRKSEQEDNDVCDA